MEKTFRALADPTRRQLLDALFELDGQSQSQLEQRIDMSRFGVMKHLRVLEDAGLITTRRIGREKLHYLNPVPIRLVHDRWVSKYTEPWTSMLSDVKQELEGRSMKKIFEIYIKSSPERIWEAITSPRLRAKYNFGASISSDWEVGSMFEMTARNGTVKLGDGEILEIDPPYRLVQTMHAVWSEEAAAEGTSRVTWEIERIASRGVVYES
jgi:DNA-binding transcriptional ArsR family regulator